MEVPGFSVTDTLPAGLTYIPGSASVEPSVVDGQTLVWEFDATATNTDHIITLRARVDSSALPGANFRNAATATVGGQSASDSVDTRIRDHGITMVTKNVVADRVPHVNGVAEDSWVIRITSLDTRPQAFTDPVDVLLFNGDGRGTSFSGTYVLSGPVQAVAGATVLYSTADPSVVVLDPADPSNGGAGDPAGSTVGWSTVFTADATAVRVIGPALAPYSQQEFTIPVVTEGATYEDRYVNVAQSRAERTGLVRVCPVNGVWGPAVFISGWFSRAVRRGRVKLFVYGVGSQVRVHPFRIRDSKLR